MDSFCHVLIWSCLLFHQFTVNNSTCFKDAKLRSLPTQHLLKKLSGVNKHGLVIGHMGNILEYQENTLEGMKSLITIKADGMHMNVQLTKDEQLILFRDDNAYRVTGENYDISKLPYSEIAKMKISKEIVYGKLQGVSKEIRKQYSSTLDVPLLRDVLTSVKGSGLVIYIEMMPGNVPPTGPLDRHRADVTARTLAQLVQELNMEMEIVVVSRDAFKLKAISAYNGNLVTAWWFDETYYDTTVADSIKYEYVDMPEIYQNNCFLNKDDGFSFTKYLLTSGIISKTINATLADFSYVIFENEKYFETQGKSMNTIIQESYGQDVPLGAFKIFYLDSTKQSKDDDIKFAESAISKGVKRYITDDVNRMKLALRETVINYSTGIVLRSGFTAFIVILLLAKCLVAVVYI